MEKVDNYSNCLEEVYIVLEKLDILKELPKKFNNYLEENKNNEYIFEYDETKNLSEQNITDETKKILTIIYHDFLCNDEEKKELDKILSENDKKRQQELNEKYGYDKMFPKKEIKKEETKETELIEYHENIFTRIIKKIKNIFRIKKQ